MTATTKCRNTRRPAAAADKEAETLTISQGWAAMLTAAAKFRTYSMNNLPRGSRHRHRATDVERHRRRKASEAKENTPRQLRRFRVAYVFAASQTEGEAVPDVRPQLLPGQAPEGMWDALAELVGAQGFALERGECGGANGFTDRAAMVVRVCGDVETAQVAKTLAHELAHVLMHGDGFDYHRCRGSAEVEAESVAHIVAAALGMDTTNYSTAYVAG